MDRATAGLVLNLVPYDSTQNTTDIIGIVKALITAAVALVLSLALLSGCKSNIDNKDAVRQGVMNYLAKRTDLLAMDVNVTSVAFHQDEATATVRFQAKGSNNPAASMSMQYVLERKGNEWVVKGREGSGSPHTGIPPGGMPPGAVPNSGSIGAMPNMPPVAPGGAAPSGQLPPGHPAIGSAPSNGPAK